MRTRHLAFLGMGVFCLAVTIFLQQRFGFFGFVVPIALIGTAIKGIWSDYEREERMSSIYSHQRSGSAPESTHYHEL